MLLIREIVRVLEESVRLKVSIRMRQIGIAVAAPLLIVNSVNDRADSCQDLVILKRLSERFVVFYDIDIVMDCRIIVQTVKSFRHVVKG